MAALSSLTEAYTDSEEEDHGGHGREVGEV